MSLELTASPATAPASAPADTRPAAPAPTDPVVPRSIALAAVDRDLGRLSEVLAEPVTAVRRAALVAHIGFLVDQIRLADADLADRQAGPLSRLRHESRCWSREPARRAPLRAAVRQAAAGLSTSRGTVRGPLAEPGRPDPAGRVRLRALPTRHPTALAYRYFWLLDELPADSAAAVVEQFTGPVRWVLRNVLSGGYNRRAYLMWFGGGTGPAL